MGDVAFVPERYPLENGDTLRAHDSGQSGYPLGANRVPLVRHCGRALLADREGLSQLSDFGALAVPDLQRDSLADGGDHGQDADPSGDPVPQHDLGSDVGWPEAELAEYLGLDRRVDVGEM